MKTPTRRSFFVLLHLLVLASLLLSIAPPAAQVAQAEPPDKEATEPTDVPAPSGTHRSRTGELMAQEEPSAGIPELSSDTIELAADCNVPARLSFGSDDEFLLAPTTGGTRSYRLHEDPTGWVLSKIRDQHGWVWTWDALDVARFDLNQVMIAIRKGDRVYTNIKTEQYGNKWAGWQDLSMTTTSAPALVVPQPRYPMVLIRNQVNQIQYKQWNGEKWSDTKVIAGADNAVSAPIAIDTSPNHMALFYLHEDGYLRVSEWIGSTNTWSPPITLKHQFEPDAQLEAISRKSGTIELAVAGADKGSSTYNFWVYHWAAGQGWQDLEPIKVADNVLPRRKPALVSRHSNHLFIGYGDVKANLYYRVAKWETNERGELVREWLPPESLNKKGTDVVVVPFDADRVLFLARLSENGSGGDQWINFHIDAKNRVIGSGSIIENDNVTGGFPIPAGGLIPYVQAHREILFFYAISYNFGHYLSWMPRSNGVSYEQITSRIGRGEVDRHAMATVGGRSYLITIWNSRGKAVIEITDVETGAQVRRQWLDYDGTHFLDGWDPVDIAVDDMDGDGNDEVFIASVARYTGRFHLTPVRLTPSGSYLDYSGGDTWSVQADGMDDPTVTIGDFDGDGQKEVVAAYSLAWQSSMRLMKFAYNGGGYEPVLTQQGITHRVDVKANDNYSGVILRDVELAAGRFYNIQGPDALQDQLIVANAFEDTRSVYWDARVFRWQNTLLSETASQYVFADDGMIHYSTLDWAVIDVAMGQIDLDPTEEVVLTVPNAIYTFDKDTKVSEVPLGAQPESSNKRPASLALADVDQDGLDEIAWASDKKLRIYDRVPSGLRLTTSTDNLPVNSRVLADDLDNDSFVAELVGCPQTFSEAKVVSVIYAPPVQLDNEGNPLNEASASYGEFQEKTNGRYSGARLSGGVSVGVGTSFEQSIPFAGTKALEIEAMVTAEFSADVGIGTSTETTFGLESEFETENNSIGMVIVASSNAFECFNYKLYRRGTPNETSSLVACSPAKNSNSLRSYHIEEWYSEQTKTELKTTWVDIGRSTRQTIPTPSMNLHNGTLIWQRNQAIPLQGTSYGWSMLKSNGQSEVVDGSVGYNVVVSAEVATTGVKASASAWFGVAYEWALETAWTDGLSYSGNLSSCSSCRPYSYTPYLYQRDVTANSGATYPIIVLDYTSQDGLLAQRSAPLAQAGPAPQAPVITSTTHLLEETWYPTSTLTVEFSQPEGHTTTVQGYRWQLDDMPGITPTLEMVETSTHTYTDLKDGLYYLNVQAVGADGQYSPVSSRAVRIDTSRPQVEFRFDPPNTTGINGWYTSTPVSVTAVVSDTDGSGIASFEYSTDNGATWQSVTGESTPPTIYEDETADATLQVRATDHTGLTTTASTPIKIDTTPPSSIDADGYGLSYGAIITNTMGNEVFVMGGVINDNLSGRAAINLRPGEQGVWEDSLTGDPVPMPPDNMFESSETSLHWVYTPTYQMRGFYNIYGQAIDQAGNTEEVEPMVEMLWTPEDTPDLSESQVILSSRETESGGQQPVMTVKLYNSGFQESSVTAVNQLPDGVRAVADSLSTSVGTASYDAASNQVTWDVPIIWPGTEQMLYFDVEVEQQGAQALTNRLTLQPYWPGLDANYQYDDIVIEDYLLDPVVIETPLTKEVSSTLALNALAAVEAAPEIYHAEVWDGEIVTEPDMEIFIDASGDTNAFRLREWTWDTVHDQWELAQESNWVTFVPTYTDQLEVYEDEIGRYGWYRWTLSPQDGVKYLSIVIRNEDGQEATLEENSMLFTNLMNRGGQELAEGEKVQYRLHLYNSELAIFNLVEFSGDANAYIWQPRNGLRPDYESVTTDIDFDGFTIDLAGFIAEENGMYVVEVHGSEQGTNYRLVPAGDVENTLMQTAAEGDVGQLAGFEQDGTGEVFLSAAAAEKLADYEQALRDGASMQELAATVQDFDRATRLRPGRPDTLSTPRLQIEPPDELPDTGPGGEGQHIYLPLVVR